MNMKLGSDNVVLQELRQQVESSATLALLLGLELTSSDPH